jgi:hypothetical protein
VIGHCIYGVDINPMAVELCKVNLWMEALEPGKPLSFLDHRIQCGNSLLGVTPALLREGIPDAAFTAIEGDDKKVCSELKKQNKRERATGQTTLFGASLEPWERLGALSDGMDALDDVDDATAGGVREKARRYERAMDSSEYRDAKLLADTWCAAFVVPKVAPVTHVVTEEVYRLLEADPDRAPAWLPEVVGPLAEQYRFFHWQVQFPDVFRVPSTGVADSDLTGWSGGFDVVLGNPPWEHTELKEKEYFAAVRPDIAEARTGAIRKRMIAALAHEDPALSRAFSHAKREHDVAGLFAGSSGLYPLCGRGRINTYAVFAELNHFLVSIRGRVGCIVPSGIATDDVTKLFFNDLVSSEELASLYSFENEEFIFPGVHHAYRFCLLTLTGPGSAASPDFVFFARQPGHLRDDDRHFSLSAEDMALLNPNTGNCAIFRSKRDAQITKGIYRRVPVLIRETAPQSNSWGLTFKQGLFNMASDSSLFRSCEDLEGDGWILDANVFRRGDRAYLPLYESKMIHHFDHRWATYDGLETRDVTPAEKADPGFVVLPRYWVAQDEIDEQLADKWDRPWLIGWRDITGVEKVRTVIASLLPRTACGHTLPLMFPAGASSEQALCLASNLTSFALDYVARQKTGGTHLTFGLLNQLPVLSPSTYEQAAPWSRGETLAEWLVPRVTELVCTAEDLAPLAKELDFHPPSNASSRWDSERRFHLRCELDAAFFHLYGLPREDVEHVMDSFWIVRNRDEAAFDEYRTKERIVAAYDHLRERSGT